MSRKSRKSKTLENAPFECGLLAERSRLGLSLADVGEAIGMSVTGLWQIETGRDVRLSTAILLADFFGVPIEQLWKPKQTSASNRVQPKEGPEVRWASD